MSDTDCFEPRSEPARSIYRAFQKEAQSRPERSCDQWIAAERQAVCRESSAQAKARGLRELPLEEIERCERYACGSVDYGATWAYAIVERMRRPVPQEQCLVA